MPTDPTLVECDDLPTPNSQPSSVSRTESVGLGWCTHGVYLPLINVLGHDALDECRVPPDLGVVLQLWTIKGDAPPLVDSQRLARTCELLQTFLPDAVIIAWY